MLVEEAETWIKQGENKKVVVQTLCEKYGIKKNTLYQALRRSRNSQHANGSLKEDQEIIVRNPLTVLRPVI